MKRSANAATPSFRQVSLETGCELLDRFVSARPAEVTSIEGATGRILAEDIRLDAAVPSFDRAAVDGIALSGQETVGASAYNPLQFHIVADGAARPGTAVGIPVAAGDPMPPGTDAVLRLDEVPEAAATLEVIDPVAPGENVEAAGSHAEVGTVLLRCGWRLRGHDLGLLAGAGRKDVVVVARPRVTIVIAGRAVVRDENGPTLCACVERDGGFVLGRPAAAREAAAIAEAVGAGGADLVLVAGGTGRGPDDETAAALRSIGEVVFHGLAITPGETAGLARTGRGVPVIMLPGTPAACFAAYELFAARAVRRLAGRPPGLPFPTLQTATARKIVSTIGRTEMVPVRCRDDGTVEPTGSLAGAGTFALAEADGFVVVPEASEGHPAGGVCTVHLFPEGTRARLS